MEKSDLFVSTLGSLFCYKDSTLVAFLVWGVGDEGFIDWLER